MDFARQFRNQFERQSVTHIVFHSAVRELLVQFTLEIVTGFLGTDPGLGSSGGILILERDIEPNLRKRFILGYCCSSHSGTATPTVHSALASHFHKFVIVDNSDIYYTLN